MRVLQWVAAIAGGLAAGGLVVMMVELFSSILHPMPAGMDPQDPKQLAEYVSGLPPSAFLTVCAAWALGALTGSLVARRFAPGQSLWAPLAVTGLFLAATLATLFAIPHPGWMWIAGIVIPPVFGAVGATLAAPASYRIDASRLVKAAPGAVFETLTNVGEFSKAVPGIVRIEFLSERQSGPGTRFRETRIINGRTASSELTLTELVDNQSCRLESDMMATHWDTRFTVGPEQGGTRLSMQTEVTPRSFLARMMVPLMLGVVTKALDEDLDSIQKYCERAS